MNLQAIVDMQIDRGDAEGQLLFWDATNKRFVVTDESKLKWDKDFNVLIVDKTVRTKRLLAGGIS
jgi:hypothetical protein